MSLYIGKDSNDNTSNIIRISSLPHSSSDMKDSTLTFDDMFVDSSNFNGGSKLTKLDQYNVNTMDLATFMYVENAVGYKALEGIINQFVYMNKDGVLVYSTNSYQMARKIQDTVYGDVPSDDLIKAKRLTFTEVYGQLESFAAAEDIIPSVSYYSITPFVVDTSKPINISSEKCSIYDDDHLTDGTLQQFTIDPEFTRTSIETSLILTKPVTDTSMYYVEDAYSVYTGLSTKGYDTGVTKLIVASGVIPHEDTTKSRHIELTQSSLTCKVNQVIDPSVTSEFGILGTANKSIVAPSVEVSDQITITLNSFEFHVLAHSLTPAAAEQDTTLMPGHSCTKFNPIKISADNIVTNKNVPHKIEILVGGTVIAKVIHTPSASFNNPIYGGFFSESTSYSEFLFLGSHPIVQKTPDGSHSEHTVVLQQNDPEPDIYEYYHTSYTFNGYDVYYIGSDGAIWVQSYMFTDGLKSYMETLQIKAELTNIFFISHTGTRGFKITPLSD